MQSRAALGPSFVVFILSGKGTKCRPMHPVEPFASRRTIIQRPDMHTQNTVPDADTYMQASRWMAGEQTSMDEWEVKAFLDSLIKTFRRRFNEVHPGGGTPRFRPMTMPPVVGPSLSVGPLQPAEPVAAVPAVDSVTLLNAIGHVASLSGKRITSSRAQLILYCVYGSWLASHGSRIEMEHPQAWKYGPVFPRAYRHSSLGDDKACADAYALLSGKHPELATLVSSKTLSMLFTTMTDLCAVHVKRSDCPHARTLSGGRGPGTEIPDEYVASFFAGR